LKRIKTTTQVHQNLCEDYDKLNQASNLNMNQSGSINNSNSKSSSKYNIVSPKVNQRPGSGVPNVSGKNLNMGKGKNY